jgi:hypothetical protein
VAQSWVCRLLLCEEDDISLSKIITSLHTTLKHINPFIKQETQSGLVDPAFGSPQVHAVLITVETLHNEPITRRIC